MSKHLNWFTEDGEIDYEHIEAQCKRMSRAQLTEEIVGLIEWCQVVMNDNPIDAHIRAMQQAAEKAQDSLDGMCAAIGILNSMIPDRADVPTVVEIDR